MKKTYFNFKIRNTDFYSIASKMFVFSKSCPKDVVKSGEN